MRKFEPDKVVNFGKYKGIKLSEVPIEYIDWFLSHRGTTGGYAKMKKKWRGIFGTERVRRLEANQ